MTKITEAGLSSKMCNNVIQVVKMVVASAVNENGEELHPRTWKHEFMDLPEVKNQRQPAHSSEAMTAIVSGSKGREQMLYVLLGASGLRFGEALGLEVDKHISDDCYTLLIRQKAWNGRVQPFLKTENGVRDIDLHPDIAAMLKSFIGNRTSGLPLWLEDRTSPLAIERLEALSAPTAQEVRPTKGGSPRISALPHDLAEKTTCSRRPHSFLARPGQQECCGRV